VSCKCITIVNVQLFLSIDLMLYINIAVVQGNVKEIFI